MAKKPAASENELMGDLIAVQYDSEVYSDVVLPDWKKSLVGTVIAMGPGLPLPEGGLAPMQTTLGDRVSFGAAYGMEGSYKGFPIRILKDTDIDFVLS